MKWQTILNNIIEFFQSFTLPSLYREEQLELQPVRIEERSQNPQHRR